MPWTRALVAGSVLVCTSCTGEVVQRLEMDLAALRERIQAREEVRIQVAGAAPVRGQLQTPTEPHVSVGCPPAVVQVVERPARKPARKASGRRSGRRGRR